MRSLIPLLLLFSCQAVACGQEDTQASPAPVTSAALAVVVSAVHAEASVGQDLVFEVRVENRGTEPLPLRPVQLSSHSTFLELSGGDWERPRYYYLRYPGGVPDLTPSEQQSLAPGEALTGTLRLPAVAAGAFSVRVGYTGAAPFPLPPNQEIEPLYSEAIPCKVTPSEAGAVRLEVEMQTNHGAVRMRFHEDVAPGTVANFVDLVRRGFYTKLGFHRVIRGFMIQGGDPQGDGSGGPGYSIPAEFSRRYPHQPGVLAMARTNHPHSAGSQFYVCLGSPRHLNGKYTVFGQVVAGQKVIEAIGALPTGPGNAPTTPATIESMRLIPVDAEGRPCEEKAAEEKAAEEKPAEEKPAEEETVEPQEGEEEPAEGE